jgi:hypothetical protein
LNTSVTHPAGCYERSIFLKDRLTAQSKYGKMRLMFDQISNKTLLATATLALDELTDFLPS